MCLEYRISSCPAGHLRHRAYFVLCSLFFVLCSSFHKAQRKQTHKATTTTKNDVQNWPKIMKKGRPGGSRRLLGEVFGLFRCPGCPRGVPGTPGAEKVTKSSSILRCFLVFWAPQNHTFSVFFDFCVVFWGMFFGSGFWRPPGIIFKGFGGGFRGVFSCFLNMLGRAGY